MSDAVSALQGATFTGAITIEEAGLRGMITLRGDLADTQLQGVVKDLAGTGFPAERGAVSDGERGICWMSPDELLILVPYDDVGSALSSIGEKLNGMHHLAANVSDARCVFSLSGKDTAIRETLAKLTPADMRRSALPAGEMRRTRLAQVPAAIWFEDEGHATVICFRSVAEYVFGILKQSASLGAEVGYFD